MRTRMLVVVVTALFLVSAQLVEGAAPSPKPLPKAGVTSNSTLSALSKLTGRDLDIAALRALLPPFEEDIEIAYAATLNADHPALLQWNQKMIERKSIQIKVLLALLRQLNAAPGRRGVNVVTPEVKTMRQLKGGPLERRYLPLMIDRFGTNVATAELAVQKATIADLKTLAGAIARTERQEIAMMNAWLKEWYGR